MAPGLRTSEGRDIHPNLERGMEKKESGEEAAVGVEKQAGQAGQ